MDLRLEKAFKMSGVAEKAHTFYNRIQEFGRGRLVVSVPSFLIARVGARVLCSFAYGHMGFPIPHNSHPWSGCPRGCPICEYSVWSARGSL